MSKQKFYTIWLYWTKFIIKWNGRGMEGNGREWNGMACKNNKNNAIMLRHWAKWNGASRDEMRPNTQQTKHHWDKTTPTATHGEYMWGRCNGM